MSRSCTKRRITVIVYIRSEASLQLLLHDFNGLKLHSIISYNLYVYKIVYSRDFY